jgi:hypothetical protein
MDAILFLHLLRLISSPFPLPHRCYEQAKLAVEIDGLVSEVEAEIAASFAADVAEQAKEQLIRLRYYDNCKRKIHEFKD